MCCDFILEEQDTRKSKFVRESAIVWEKIAMPEDANPGNINVNGGVVLQLIDNIAGISALRHCRTRTVTASIDKMDFIYPVKVGELIIIKASVNHVFGTSLEVGVRVDVENIYTGETHTTGRAYLTFVAVDQEGHPIKVPYLVQPETEIEKRRYKEAQKRRKLRLDDREKMKDEL
jgi:acyl-CoA hydrolase